MGSLPNSVRNGHNTEVCADRTVAEGSPRASSLRSSLRGLCAIWTDLRHSAGWKFKTACWQSVPCGRLLRLSSQSDRASAATLRLFSRYPCDWAMSPKMDNKSTFRLAAGRSWPTVASLDKQTRQPQTDKRKRAAK